MVNYSLAQMISPSICQLPHLPRLLKTLPGRIDRTKFLICLPIARLSALPIGTSQFVAGCSLLGEFSATG